MLSLLNLLGNVLHSIFYYSYHNNFSPSFYAHIPHNLYKEFSKLIDFFIAIWVCGTHCVHVFLGYSIFRMFVKYVHQIMKHFCAIDWRLRRREPLLMKSLSLIIFDPCCKVFMIKIFSHVWSTCANVYIWVWFCVESETVKCFKFAWTLWMNSKQQLKLWFTKTSCFRPGCNFIYILSSSEI